MTDQERKASDRLKAGELLAVPKQVSWRTAARLQRAGLGRLELFVNRWCATLHPVAPTDGERSGTETTK